MPFICNIRNDIPDGILQILDLTPNTSQRSLIYEPPPQTKYVNRVTNDTVVTSGAGPIITTAEFAGVGAYLIDHVEDADNAGIALTAARANAIALALIVIMDAGGVLDLAAVDAAIQVETGGAASGLEANASTGSLAELLSIMAGAPYVLPAASAVETGGNAFDTTVSGAFPEGTYRATYTTGSLTISIGDGQLAAYTAATFEYAEAAGAACVVYDDDGTLLS